MQDIDFDDFEEVFKAQTQTGPVTQVDGKTKVAVKRETSSLLDSNRLQNISIVRRKIELTNAQIVEAIKKWVQETVLSLYKRTLLFYALKTEETKTAGSSLKHVRNLSCKGGSGIFRGGGGGHKRLHAHDGRIAQSPLRPGSRAHLSAMEAWGF